jgi:hypothetical protein
MNPDPSEEDVERFRQEYVHRKEQEKLIKKRTLTSMLNWASEKASDLDDEADEVQAFLEGRWGIDE